MKGSERHYDLWVQRQNAAGMIAPVAAGGSKSSNDMEESAAVRSQPFSKLGDECL